MNKELLSIFLRDFCEPIGFENDCFVYSLKNKYLPNRGIQSKPKNNGDYFILINSSDFTVYELRKLKNFSNETAIMTIPNKSELSLSSAILQLSEMDYKKFIT